jgi:TrmH family RNA methyltransferase
MTPFHKLEKLPRPLKLRKITKRLEETERRLRAGTPLKPEESSCLDAVLALLNKDTALPAEIVRLSVSARESAGPEEQIRRLNALRHLLLAETGKSQADWDFIDPEGSLDPLKRRIFPGMTVYLEDIRSPFNVGSMFRTAESFGAEKLLLSPFCADPHHPRAERTARGCTETLHWERLSGDNPAETLREPLFALETGGTPLRDFRFPGRGVMIVGSEELGVSPQALRRADASLGRVSIPLYGAKGSLNASVAFGIAMQSWSEAFRR